MPRDKRFIAAHRGGELQKSAHRLLAMWAADCAEHVSQNFTKECPSDDRVRDAIAAARAWSREEISVGAARKAASRAHAAAREASGAAAVAAARAAGHAVATAHMADHSLGCVYYGIKAVKAASLPAETEREYRWQCARLPDQIRGLVLAAINEGTVLGSWRP